MSGVAAVACAPCKNQIARATLGAKAAPVTVAAEAEVRATRVAHAKLRIEVLLEDSMRFWLTHGRDAEHGGFHATLNRLGEPIEPSTKGLVQQTRHLWTFSAYYRLNPTADAARRTVVRQCAAELFRFIVQHFRDPSDGEFYFRVDRKGNPLDRSKHLYANSFAIYALAEYALAFGVAEAKAHALACFSSLDKSSHDAQFGGYYQTNRPNWLGPGAAKDTNTHIHLMESLTALYGATKDPLVRQRAEELLRVVLTKHVQPSRETHAEFTRDFSPIGAPTISYGHDIETAWLLFDSIDTLGLKDRTKLREQAFQLGLNAATQGFDPKLGGFFEEGIPNGAPTKLEKVWWVQAEAIAGLCRLFRYRAEPRLLEQLEATLDFIETYLRDPNLGEWYWSVLPDGSFGQHRDIKGAEWKSSYHVVRALLFARNWMNGA